MIKFKFRTSFSHLVMTGGMCKKIFWSIRFNYKITSYTSNTIILENKTYIQDKLFFNANNFFLYFMTQEQ